MANAIDKLFDSVLPGLQPSPTPEWPKFPDNDVHEDEAGFPGNLDDSTLVPLDEEVERVRPFTERVLQVPVVGQVSEEEVEIIGGGVRHRGFEALAFYKSKRHINQRPFRGKWGIFYLRQGLHYVEAMIADHYPGYGDVPKLAIQFLREHERFHYRADVQTLLFEATLGREKYQTLRKALRGRGSWFVEEALANRQVWDWSKRAGVGIEELAYDFMTLQPNAYARFAEPRLELAGEWAANTVDFAPPNAGVLRMDLAHWVEATPTGLQRASLCPEYVVTPNRLTDWLSPALVLPPVKTVSEEPNVTKDLSGKLAHLQVAWKRTKDKLIANRLLPGLNFKPWPMDGHDAYSVRLDRGFRAHLRHLGQGDWTVFKMGSHAHMGHG